MVKVIPEATLPNHYELIGHFLGQNGVDTWRNSIVVFQSSGQPQPTDPIIQAMVEWWRLNLITTCSYVKSELRAWTRGDVPFSNEGAIWNSTVGAGIGQKTNVASYGAEGTAGVGKEVVGFVRIFNTIGREGKMFMRALLDNADVFSSAGGPWVFITPGPPNVTPTKFANTAVNTIGLYFGSANPGLRVVHFSIKHWNASGGATPDAPFGSDITSMQLVGPTLNKPTRKSSR